MMTKYTKQKQVGHLKYFFVNTVSCLYANISLILRNNTPIIYKKEKGRTFSVKNLLHLHNPACHLKQKLIIFKITALQFVCVCVKYLTFSHKYCKDNTLHSSLFVAFAFHKCYFGYKISYLVISFSYSQCLSLETFVLGQEESNFCLFLYFLIIL